MHAVDPSKPSVARMYDYFLGGKDNYHADRDAAEKILKIEPETRVIAMQNRAFLRRVVRYLAQEAGIRQFLDIGTGIPTMENVHDVAQRVAPESRIVYVDNDDAVLAHARALLVGHQAGECAYVDADLRDTKSVLAGAAGTLDFSKPVAVLLFAILHFIPDEDDPWEVVTRLVEAISPGSYLAVSHALPVGLTSDQRVELDKVYSGTNAGGVTQRSASGIAQFFRGLELVDPGLAEISAWRPEQGENRHPTLRLFYGGVGKKKTDNGRAPG